MILNKIDDPRDNLERAKRGELVAFAQAHGLRHVTWDTPAILIRAELRAKGITNIRVPPRPLGSQAGRHHQAMAAPNQKVLEVNAAADLARQFEQQQAAPPPTPLPRTDKPKRLAERPRSEINRLRDECKRLGIKMERKDNLTTLKAKIATKQQESVS